MKLSTGTSATALGIALALLAPATSFGATTVGKAEVNGTQQCGATLGPYNLVQKTNAGSGINYVIPGDGVITSWTTALAGSTSVALRVYDIDLIDPTKSFIPTADSAPVAFSNAAALVTTPTRIPVKTGQLIGLRVDSGGFPLTGCRFGVLGDTTRYHGGALAIGASAIFDLIDDSRLNLAVSEEPDVDKDGYGDETQDACPANPAVQASCSPPDAPVLSKTPKAKTPSPKANFAFSATGAVSYACRLDKGAFAACSSPAKFKKLKPGKHKFRVHGVSAGGTAGPDTKFKWKVGKKK